MKTYQIFGYDRSLSFCAVILEWVEFFLLCHENKLLKALRDKVIVQYLGLT